MGTVDNGKMANLVITDKSYFNEKAKVRYVFVDGKMFKMDIKEVKKGDPNAKVELEGSWSTVTESPQGRSEGKLTFKKEGSGYSASGRAKKAPGDRHRSSTSPQSPLLPSPVPSPRSPVPTRLPSPYPPTS
jgi:hypothetical protein